MRATNSILCHNLTGVRLPLFVQVQLCLPSQSFLGRGEVWTKCQLASHSSHLSCPASLAPQTANISSAVLLYLPSSRNRRYPLPNRLHDISARTIAIPTALYSHIKPRGHQASQFVLPWSQPSVAVTARQIKLDLLEPSGYTQESSIRSNSLG